MVTHSSCSNTLYSCKETNIERKNPLKLLWEWDLTFRICIQPLLTSVTGSFVIRDLLFRWHKICVSFYCPLNLPLQSQFWQTWHKKSLQEKIPTSHEVSGDYTQNKPAWHCSITWFFLIKGNLCGLRKQTASL